MPVASAVKGSSSLVFAISDPLSLRQEVEPDELGTVTKQDNRRTDGPVDMTADDLDAAGDQDGEGDNH